MDKNFIIINQTSVNVWNRDGLKKFIYINDFCFGVYGDYTKVTVVVNFWSGADSSKAKRIAKATFPKNKLRKTLVARRMHLGFSMSDIDYIIKSLNPPA
jgi:hypothetical protein